VEEVAVGDYRGGGGSWCFGGYGGWWCCCGKILITNCGVAVAMVELREEREKEPKNPP